MNRSFERLGRGRKISSHNILLETLDRLTNCMTQIRVPPRESRCFAFAKSEQVVDDKNLTIASSPCPDPNRRDTQSPRNFLRQRAGNAFHQDTAGSRVLSRLGIAHQALRVPLYAIPSQGMDALRP